MYQNGAVMTPDGGAVMTQMQMQMRTQMQMQMHMQMQKHMRMQMQRQMHMQVQMQRQRTPSHKPNLRAPGPPMPPTGLSPAQLPPVPGRGSYLTPKPSVGTEDRAAWLLSFLPGKGAENGSNMTAASVPPRDEGNSDGYHVSGDNDICDEPAMPDSPSVRDDAASSSDSDL